MNGLVVLKFRSVRNKTNFQVINSLLICQFTTTEKDLRLTGSILGVKSAETRV